MSLSVTIVHGAAKSNDCRLFYISVPAKKTMIDIVKEQLKQNPNSSPLYLVSDSIKISFRELSARYESILKLIAAKGTKNKLSFSVTTTNETLEAFQDLNRKLSDEVEKNKHDQKKIAELANKMKMCLSNLNTCETNLTIALKDAQNDFDATKQLMDELKNRLPELDQVLAELPKLNILSEAELSLVTSTIVQQKKLIGSDYLLILEKHLHAQKILKDNADAMATNTIEWARMQAASLQSRASIDMNALNLEDSDLKTTIEKNEIDFNFEFKPHADLHEDANNANKKSIENAKFFQQRVNASEQTEFGKRFLKELKEIADNKRNETAFDLFIRLSYDPSYRAISLNEKDLAFITNYLIENDGSITGDSFLFYISGIQKFESDWYSSKKDGAFLNFLYFMVNPVSAKGYNSFVDWVDRLFVTKESELEREIENSSGWILKRKIKKKLKRMKEIHYNFKWHLLKLGNKDKTILYDFPIGTNLIFQIFNRNNQELFKKTIKIEDLDSIEHRGQNDE